MLAVILSTIPIEFESIIGAICCNIVSICASKRSAEMNAIFANDAAAKTSAERRAVSTPKRNVWVFFMSDAWEAYFNMKNLIIHMQPPNFASHSTEFNAIRRNPDIPADVAHWVMNMYAVDIPPRARPAIPARFQMFLLFIAIYLYEYLHKYSLKSQKFLTLRSWINKIRF